MIMTELVLSAVKRTPQAQWNMFIDELKMLAVPALIGIFFVVSLILFLKDEKKAKQEGRARKTYTLVMLVIAMALVSVTVLIMIGLALLSAVVMTSM